MNDASRAAKPQIWVVTDGRPGNENPALGLAERVAARLGPAAEIQRFRIALRPWATLAPAPLWPLLGAAPEGWPFTGLAEGRDLGARAAAEPPALVVSAGRRSAPVAAAIATLGTGRTRSVQILDPKMGAGRFDLVIAPQHDGPAGPGRHATVGSLHGLDPSAPPPVDPRLAALIGAPKIALLIGGRSRSASFGDFEAGALLSTIRAAAAAGGALAASASRRTPESAAAEISAAIRGAGGFFWDGGGDNPYRAMLFWADALIATADSVNMASEACALGKPVLIAPAERRAPKFEAFHAALFAGGHARPLDPGAETAELIGWRQTRLDDMTGATDAAAALLGR